MLYEAGHIAAGARPDQNIDRLSSKAAFNFLLAMEITQHSTMEAKKK